MLVHRREKKKESLFPEQWSAFPTAKKKRKRKKLQSNLSTVHESAPHHHWLWVNVFLQVFTDDYLVSFLHPNYWWPLALSRLMDLQFLPTNKCHWKVKNNWKHIRAKAFIGHQVVATQSKEAALLHFRRALTLVKTNQLSWESSHQPTDMGNAKLSN